VPQGSGEIFSHKKPQKEANELSQESCLKYVTTTA
jgi:hypothetical protein